MLEVATISELLNIGALAHAVGIPAETLRTWERRYGFPNAQRTPSGHRRYTPEIRERLLRVKKLLDRGHRPSTILPWSLEQLDQELGRADEAKLTIALPTGRSTTSLDQLVDQALTLVRKYDARKFDQLMHRACSEMGSMNFLTAVVSPLLTALGQTWAEGSTTIAQEHFASERIRSFLVAQWRPFADRNHGPPVLCATLSGEDHVLGLHMLALVLAVAGMRISFLGADTPVSQVALAAREQSALVTAISVSSSAEPSRTTRELNQLRQELGAIPLMVGGGGAIASLDGIFVVQDLPSARDWVAGLVAAQ